VCERERERERDVIKEIILYTGVSARTSATSLLIVLISLKKERKDFYQKNNADACMLNAFMLRRI